MSIKVGDQIPEENLVVMSEKDGPQGFSLREYCKGKKIVLIGAGSSTVALVEADRCLKKMRTTEFCLLK